jgi:hypothetical protein
MVGETGFEPATPWSRIGSGAFAYATRARMRWQAVDFPALTSRLFMAPVARSVRKLPAVTALTTAGIELCLRARSEIFDEPLTPSRPRP